MSAEQTYRNSFDEDVPFPLIPGEMLDPMADYGEPFTPEVEAKILGTHGRVAGIWTRSVEPEPEPERNGGGVCGGGSDAPIYVAMIVAVLYFCGHVAWAIARAKGYMP